MSKVIKFKTDYRLTPEYHRELNLSVKKLDDFGNELIGLMINLATIGKWKDIDRASDARNASYSLSDG